MLNWGIAVFGLNINDMTEKFINDPGTTLSSGCTNVAATVNVASAAGYPTTGNFRIRIDNELMLVTAVSGTTWTVTRGIESTSAIAHSGGTPVNHVYTAGSHAQALLDNNQSGALSSLPTAGNAGSKFFPTDAPFMYYDNGTTWNAIGPVYQCNPPTSSWTLYRTNANTTVSYQGSALMSNNGTNCDANLVNAAVNLPSSGSFLISARVRVQTHWFNNDIRAAIVIGDTSNNKCTTFGYRANSGYYYNIFNWNNFSTTFNFNNAPRSNTTGTISSVFNNDVWMGVYADSGTNQYFILHSFNGRHFQSVDAVAFTDWIPRSSTQIAGIYMGQAGSLPMACEVVSFDVITNLTNYIIT